MKLRNIILLVCVNILSCVLVNICYAVDDGKVTNQNVFTGTLRVYQKVLSPTKGSYCSMTPSDSNYAYQSFSKYNPAKAYVMTADRLMRCGHDLNNYKKVYGEKQVLYCDAVDSNGGKDKSENSDIQSDKGNGSINIPSTEVRNDEDKLFTFATELENQGIYNDAVLEYKRLLSYFPFTKHKNRALIGIVHCYYESNRYLDAIYVAGKEDVASMEDADKMDLNISVGKSYFKLENYPKAVYYFSQNSGFSRNRYLADQSILMEGLSYVYDSKWGEAKKTFARIGGDSQYYGVAENARLLCDGSNRIKYKKPALAATLSVVPGLGYLYSGYPQTALSALLVNGMFMLGTYQAFNANNSGLGAIMGVFALGWYSGNIYGAYTTAERKNISLRNEYLARFSFGFKL